MKNFTRILSLCMVLVMCFSLTAFASAAEVTADGGSATSSVTLSSTADGSLNGDSAATAMSVTVPTVLPNTKVENDMINSYTDLKTKFSPNKGEANILCDQIAAGYVQDGMNNAEEAVATTTTAWGGAQYLQLKQLAWDRLVAYYDTLN